MKETEYDRLDFKELAKLRPRELPPIELHPDAKAIAKGWQERCLATQSLSPSIGRTAEELFNDYDYDDASSTDAMCGDDAGRWLSKSFGPPIMKVDGKSLGAACRVYGFMGVAILSFSESGLGTSWQFLLGPADALGGGRSYGRADLLSFDKEISAFWRPFCRSMSAQMAMHPLEAKAEREARSMEDRTPLAEPGPKPRL